MPYTLWSRNRLLGESDLGYARLMPKHRIGDFQPTELGEKLMPIVTGVSRTLLDLARTSHEMWGTEDRGSGSDPIDRLDEMRGTTEYADAAAAEAHFDGLELELRAPDGSIVPAEWIDVRDMASVLAFIDDDEPPDYGEIDFDDEEEAQLAADIEHDAALIDEWFGPDALDEPVIAAGDVTEQRWDEETFPRYQIQVMLLDDAAVP